MNGIPSYYGGALFTQFAEQGKIHEYTLKYLKLALFEEGEAELEASKEYNDVSLDWNYPENLDKQRAYEPNEGWIWDGDVERYSGEEQITQGEKLIYKANYMGGLVDQRQGV